mmetsp:Transcript_44132/g.140247  ORF Transcript_44132/g.140247 Transcript_44132/m.140247 type:complete len:127 (-) Transcript_44132:87-467(-)
MGKLGRQAQIMCPFAVVVLIVVGKGKGTFGCCCRLSQAASCCEHVLSVRALVPNEGQHVSRLGLPTTSGTAIRVLRRGGRREFGCACLSMCLVRMGLPSRVSHISDQDLHNMYVQDLSRKLTQVPF